MRYLFFDIECSNTFYGEGKICEFGFVITDEQFNILDKHNYVMSPGPKGNHDWSFDNSRARIDKGFERWFDPIEYYSCNEFPYFYDRIYELLTDKDTLVFGFAVENDINYIDYTCYRYNKEKPKYFAIDTKHITDAYAKIYPDSRFKAGLDDCFKKFYSVNEFIRIKAHKAVNDAYMTMMVMKAMCNLYKKNVNELVSLYPGCKLDSSKNRTNWAMNKISREKALEERNKCKEEWDSICKQYIGNANAANAIYLANEFKNNKIMFDRAISFIKENNYVPVRRLFNAKYVLVIDEYNKRGFLKSINDSYKGNIIIFSERNKSKY